MILCGNDWFRIDRAKKIHPAIDTSPLSLEEIVEVIITTLKRKR
jgi:hypothetical protein